MRDSVLRRFATNLTESWKTYVEKIINKGNNKITELWTI